MNRGMKMKRKQKYQWPEFTMGVCYYPEHWEENLWESDLDRMLDAGIRVVRIAEFSWALTEPEEGVFDFSLFDRFLELCRDKGMKVIMGTPSATPPAWLTKRYPEVLNCTEEGVPYRHGGRRHYNYNSQIYREKVSRIVTGVAEHFGTHPAVCGWQIDNELNCETDDFKSEADNAAFRVFLKDKYGSLENLNRAWGTVFWSEVYFSFDEICVPGRVINQAVNPHQHLDYIRFVSESANSFCRMQSEILRRYIKPGDFITTNGMFGHLDNHRMAEESLDFYTYDSYPNFAYMLARANAFRDGSGGGLRDRRWSRHLAEVRSVCPHFGIMEQQAGAGSWTTRMEGPFPAPGQLKLWAMQSLAHGADFISFFRWRTCTFGTEMYWHGILDYDNRDNRRLAEVRDFGDTMRKIAPLCGAEMKARFAVVRDYDNEWDEEADRWHSLVARPSDEAIFEAAQRAHISYDYLYLREGTGLEELSRYKVLFYPHPMIVTSERAELLEEYVRQGGTLVIGCRAGYKDETGKCVMLPQPGLLQVLTGTDVREFSFQNPAEEVLTADWGNEKIPMPVFHDILDLTEEESDTLKVLARWHDHWFSGSAALVEKKTGSGRTLHLGSTFCRENLKKLFNYLGLDRLPDPIAELPESVELAEREKDGKDYLVLLNYLPEEQTFTLKKEMCDLCSGESLTGECRIKGYGVRVLA